MEGAGMDQIVIRPDISAHMRELRQWLEETKNEPLEEMADFFRVRLDQYEEHMALWQAAYRRLPELIPETAHSLLDLGCGTGLEIDEIFKCFPDLDITGVDLSWDMLSRLQEKHPQVRCIQGDYFQTELGNECFDCAVSVESLHHFTPNRKLELFRRLYRALKPGGVFLEVDYLACCPEEEELLMETCRNKRRSSGIPEDVFVHFDTPLTVEHETALLRQAGFTSAEPEDCIAGACFLLCKKGI